MSRREQLLRDIAAAVEILKDVTHPIIRDVTFDESSLRFQLGETDQVQREISICFDADDYPYGTLIYGLHEKNFGAAESSKLTVEESIRKVFEAYLKEKNPAEKMDSADEKCTEFLENNDDAIDSCGDDDDGIETNEILKRDIRDTTEVFGPNSCVLRHHCANLDVADLKLHVAVVEVPKNMARALNLDLTKDIVIELSEISVAHYRSAGAPKIDLCQDKTQKDKALWQVQLQRILKQYLSDHWSNNRKMDSDNILTEIILYTSKRLPTLCDYCIICDNKHDVTSLLMPSVCQRKLCVFAYETLGVCASFGLAYASQLEVVDLLLKLFQGAATSHRRELILEPYPTIPDPTDKTQLALSDTERNYDKVLTIVSGMPCSSKLSNIYEDGLHVSNGSKEESTDLLLFPLIRWVLASNRAYLMKLPQKDQLSFVGTRHQFLMLLDSPAKEAAFREAKKQFGESVFAFHGSPIENWHSILRRGLINASGTKLQLVGQAHGPGIYLSPRLSVSNTYAAQRGGHFKTLPLCTQLRQTVIVDGVKTVHDCTDNGRFLSPYLAFSCIALCEVVKGPHLKQTTSKDIWVLSDANMVCTRFLLIYDSTVAVSQMASCETENCLVEIKAAMEKFRNFED